MPSNQYPFIQLRLQDGSLEHGAEFNYQDKDGCTPLHVAAGRGRVDILELLLAHGVRKDLKSNDGMTPQDYAEYPDDHSFSPSKITRYEFCRADFAVGWLARFIYRYRLLPL